MSRAQVRAVGLCLVINLIDGFDLLVTSFVGPGDHPGVEPLPVGSGCVLFSGGLASMALGGLFLAPLADRVGRRRLTIGCLALATLGMLATAASQDFGQMLACRVVTGAAVGAMAASLPVLTSEYANHRRRGLVVALITTGYGLGSVVAGIAASILLGAFGWRSVFVFGAVVTVILFAAALRFLPESMDFLVVRRPRQALDKLNRILVSMGHTPVDDLPTAPSAATSRKVVLDSLFRGRNAVRTVLVWVAFVAARMMFYFASSWTPSLLLKAGMSGRQGISGGLLLSLGGVTGAVLLGLLVSRVDPRRLTAAYFGIGFGIGALTLILFSSSLGTLAIALVVAVLVGLFLNGTVTGINVIVPGLHPAGARATALGLAVAVSRLGAVLAPLLAGFLLQAGWAPASMFRLFAIPLGVIGAAPARPVRASRPDHGGPAGRKRGGGRMTEFDPDHTGVLVIDIRNAFVEEGVPLEFPEERRVIPAVQKVQEAACGRNMPIVRRPGGVDMRIHREPYPPVAAGEATVDGKRGVEIHPERAPRPGEPVVKKYRYNASSYANDPRSSCAGSVSKPWSAPRGRPGAAWSGRPVARWNAVSGRCCSPTRVRPATTRTSVPVPCRHEKCTWPRCG